jgi:hypothetical protein
MTLLTRMTLILTLLLPAAGVLFAQETATTKTTTTTTAEAATTTGDPEEVEAARVEKSTDEAVRQGSYETRTKFSALVRNEPNELAMILALDPSLLTNDTFLNRYPEVAAFVAEHPEVRRSPRFFMDEFPVPGRGQHTMADDLLQGLLILSIFTFIAFVLAWLVRTTIEQKRWNRLSRTQTEVHNKILDRFSSTPELLEYVRSPAGSKFLESAPIPVHSSSTPTQNAPMTRIMWSIQVGVVVMAAALGLLLVSLRFDGETSQGFFAIGAIVFCIGGGFIASALVSMALSRRLGLWQSAPESASLDPGA